MIFLFDTETTGLPVYASRSSDPVQPHLVQLALLLCQDDGTEVSRECVIVRPEGWTISPEIAAIHGITQERALAEGIPENDAVAMFMFAQSRAEIRVAHNEEFDRRIMRIAMTQAGVVRAFIEHIEARLSFCTCRQSQAIVNLPPTEKMLAKGMKSPKAPKLEECMRHFFDEALPGSHDAMVDVAACARVYFHLQSLGTK